MSPQGKRFCLGPLVQAGFGLLAGLVVLFGSVPHGFPRVRHHTDTVPNDSGMAAGTSRRAVPTPQLSPDTLPEVRGALRRLDRLAGTLDDTLHEYRELARAMRALVPEWQGVAKAARETIPEWRGVARATQAMFPEFQALARDTRQVLPEVRRTLQQMQVTANSWGMLGERLYIFMRTNEDTLEKTVGDLHQALAGAAQALGEENRQNLAAALRNVRAGSNGLAGLAYRADEFVKEGQAAVRQVGIAARRADALLADVQGTLRPVPDRLQNIFKNLDESTDRLNKLLGDAREFWRATVSADGSCRRFFCDPTLYNHLDDAACLLNRTLPRLDRILRDLEVFSDKIARHPETLGLGGVVRPSAGLKEGPSSFYPGPHGP